MQEEHRDISEPEDVDKGKRDKYATVSVFKYGKSGWRAQFPYKDDSGKWRTKNRVLSAEGRDKGRSTKARDNAMREAEDLRKQMNAEERAASEAQPENRLTVSQCVSAYIDTLDIGRSTETSYRGMLKRHIAPRIGDMLLSDFTKGDAQAWVDWMGDNYARPVVANSLRLLRAALDYAADEEQGWVSRNVAKKAKQKKDESPEQDRPNALTDGEYARVLSVIDSALNANGGSGYGELPHMLAIKIALLSGLRRAEICALRWRCVDFNRGSVSVVMAIGQTDNGFYLKQPKSKSSRRTVECPEELMRDLKRRRAAMMEQCVSAGIPFDEDLYVVGGIDGQWMKPPRLDDHWRPLSKTLGIRGTQNKPVTFHCLRHTYATRLIQAGVDIATVADLMGHSKTSITLDRYTSTGSHAKRRAADVLGEASARTVAEYGGDNVVELDKTGTEG